VPISSQSAILAAMAGITDGFFVDQFFKTGLVGKVTIGGYSIGEKMIEAARWAQSGANAQPWEFIVVKEKETIDAIAALWSEHQKRVWAIEKTRIREMRHRAYIDEPVKPRHFGNAPVLIILCGDPRTVQATVLITHFLPNDGGPGAHFLKNMANEIYRELQEHLNNLPTGFPSTESGVETSTSVPSSKQNIGPSWQFQSTTA